MCGRILLEKCFPAKLMGCARTAVNRYKNRHLIEVRSTLDVEIEMAQAQVDIVQRALESAGLPAQSFRG